MREEGRVLEDQADAPPFRRNAGEVRSGEADLPRTLGAESGDGLVPVVWEDFDIVLSGDALPAAEPLISTLRDPSVQSLICALGGYDVSRAGSVELLT